jgi:hypothetical protein
MIYSQKGVKEADVWIVKDISYENIAFDVGKKIMNFRVL